MITHSITSIVSRVPGSAFWKFTAGLAFMLLLTCSTRAQTIPDPVVYSATYSYDDAGRLIGADIEQQLNIQYTYDASGRITAVDQTAFSGVGVESTGEGLPVRFALHDAYPNPFNPSTVVRYDVPISGRVTISVFDVLGRRVSILADRVQDAGRHTITWEASGISSGTYFILMQAGKKRFSRPVVLMR